MATNDLYFCRVNASTNNRAWGFGFWLQEEDPISAGGDGHTVALAVEAQLNTVLRDCIATDSEIESYHCSKRFVGSVPAGQVFPANGTGTRSGDALPNDNALYLNLLQSFTFAKHNGGLYIGGQSSDDTTDSKFNAAYLTTQVAALATALIGNFDAIGPETGRWRLQILSTTLSPPTTGIGTPIDVVKVQATDRVMTQSRRRQRVKGFA